jgi:type VI secretion system protein ImpH
MRESLFNESFRFEFFQAVRVLESLYPDRERVGRTDDPAREVVRFGARLSLSFPASEIQHTTAGDGENEQPAMTVNFMGLTGPTGVLPHHYTELLIDRVYHKDFALRDFFDLFNHRFITLFYRAWEKYHFQVTYGEDDAYTEYLFSLIGMGTPGLRGRMAFNDEGLLLYVGLLSQRPRSAPTLDAVLRDYFDVPVSSRQFLGRWINLSEENRSRLGAQNSELGMTVICGERVWDQQSKFRVRVGPLDLATFEAFLPGGPAYERLMQLTRFIAGPEHDFDVQLILKAEEVPACRLKSETGARLGWSSWVKIREFTRDAEETLLACNN